MSKLRRISGKDLIRLLQDHGFVVIRQKGSHVRLAFSESGSEYRLTVPVHEELDRGTLKEIVRSVNKCLPEETIKKLFYS